MDTTPLVRTPPLLSFALIALLSLLTACGGEKANEADNWSLMLSDLPGALTSVWGTSATDVWAVGGDPDDRSGNTVLHYDGSQWERLTTGYNGDLWWVFGFADGPVYMSGKNGLVLKYQNGTFERMDTPGTATVYGIWGVSPNDLWAVGGNVTGGAFAWRYEGEGWQPAEGFPGEIAASDSLFKAWGSSNNDVWLIGTGGITIHFDGTTFSTDPSQTTRHLFTVHGRTGDYAAVGGFGSGVIVQHDGQEWKDVTPNGAPHVIGVYLDDKGSYAVGVEGSVLRREDGKWQVLDTGLDLIQALHAVWVDPEGGVWAAGGQVLAPPLVNGVLLHRKVIASDAL